MTTYRSEADFDERFGRVGRGRRAVVDRQLPRPPGRASSSTGSTRRPTGSWPGPWTATTSATAGAASRRAFGALADAGTRADRVGIEGDILYGPRQVRALVEAAAAAGVDARYREIRSTKGHDAFLVEWDQLTALLARGARPALAPAARPASRGRPVVWPTLASGNETSPGTMRPLMCRASRPTTVTRAKECSGPRVLQYMGRPGVISPVNALVLAMDDLEILPATMAMSTPRRDDIVEAIYDDHQRELYSFALHACRDREAAEDLVQEVVRQADVEVDAGRTPTNVRAWLYRVVANLCGLARPPGDGGQAGDSTRYQSRMRKVPSPPTSTASAARTSRPRSASSAPMPGRPC